jgi:hypothetical protein
VAGWNTNDLLVAQIITLLGAMRFEIYVGSLMEDKKNKTRENLM